MPSSKILSFFFLLLISIQSVRPQLFGGWTGDDPTREEEINAGNSIEEEVTSRSRPLNIGNKDSPYALMHTFFKDRESEHERRKNLFAESYKAGQVRDPPKGLRPEDVWLSEGSLLVLKGGTPDESLSGDGWKPLDDYEAPYREPKLPPPDFVPSDIGVGVPLIDDKEYTDSPQAEKEPVITTQIPPSLIIKTLKPYDDFIYDMENFHSIKRTPYTPTTLRPTTTSTPSSSTKATSSTPTTTSSPIIYVTAPPSLSEDPPVATHLPILLLRRRNPNEIDDDDDNRIILRNKGKRRHSYPRPRAPRFLHSSGALRRNGERYVSFIQGAARGGNSWSYSYRY